MMINEYEDIIPGGLADAFSPNDFDPKQLKAGIKVELEHTNDPKIAREIAMDHLTEDPLYYQKLKTIEDEGVLREYVNIFLSEMFYVTKAVPQEMIDDLADRGINIWWFGPKTGWDPRMHGLTEYQVEAITEFLKRKMDEEKSLTPEESASNFKIEDIAIANVLGDKKDPSNIQRAKIFNISHLIDDVKDLTTTNRSMNEAWSEHLDKVIDGGEEFPWSNEEEPEINKNPMNPYDANNSLSKVKVSVPSTYKSQRAGVKKGSGPPGGGRLPGGKRQGITGR